jgi:flagellar biosynthetic protein FlhB
MDEELESQDQRTEEPSQHRIDQFRKRGEVSSSKELTSVLILFSCFLTIGMTLIFAYEEMTLFVEYLYGLNYEQAYNEKNFKQITERIIEVILKCIGPLFIVSIVVSIVSNVSQFGFLWSPEVLEIKPERINPISGFKRLFSLKSFVEAIKGVCKFSIILLIVYFYMEGNINTFSGFFHLSFLNSFFYGKELILKLGYSIVLGMGLIALGDFVYQKISYLNKLKQTKEQVKREQKEQDGNPEIKQRIRVIQRDAATQRMMSEIAKADVVVTNPTHISVALKYDIKKMISPIVVAKGADFLAFKIREIANEHEIPLVENKPLARTLYKTVKIGQAIPRDLYKAIAEVLAFVYKLKKKRTL